MGRRMGKWRKGEREMGMREGVDEREMIKRKGEGGRGEWEKGKAGKGKEEGEKSHNGVR